MSCFIGFGGAELVQHDVFQHCMTPLEHQPVRQVARRRLPRCTNVAIPVWRNCAEYFQASGLLHRQGCEPWSAISRCQEPLPGHDTPAFGGAQHSNPECLCCRTGGGGGCKSLANDLATGHGGRKCNPLFAHRGQGAYFCVCNCVRMLI
jgi:hypothetical protein